MCECAHAYMFIQMHDIPKFGYPDDYKVFKEVCMCSMYETYCIFLYFNLVLFFKTFKMCSFAKKKINSYMNQ